MNIPETDGEISSGVSTKAFEDGSVNKGLCISSCILCTSAWQIDVNLDTGLQFLFPNVSSLRLQIDVLTYNLLSLPQQNGLSGWLLFAFSKPIDIF